MLSTKIIDTFQKARHDTALAVIEGVQALKHAVRFKADIEQVITYDIKHLESLLDELAPDVEADILKITQEVSEADFSKLSRQPHRTKVMALGKRRQYKLGDLDAKKPIIYLENPKDLENIGAVIRVAAAANAGGVLISSDVDIWHTAVIRGAAGLHWALPVLNVVANNIFTLKRPIIALDPSGEEMSVKSKNGVFIFGTERHGISPELLDKSDCIARLPMRSGVSSLNLATSVSATLYRLW
jgi:RNA methyltransferase, TrmH family